MSDDLSDLAARLYGPGVGPVFSRKMAESGVADPAELPLDLAFRMLIEAIAEAAPSSAERPDTAKLERRRESFAHPLFTQAFANLRRHIDSTTDPFERSSGVDAALVMAALGIPVAPLDKRSDALLGAPSTALEEVAESFEGLKTALVGYNTCASPFYLLVTDSLSDLRTKLVTDPVLEPVAAVLGRIGEPLPAGTGHPFEHLVALFGRKPADRFRTLFINDPTPFGGTVLFAAGWMEGREPAGSWNDGWLPIPGALLRDAVTDPQLAFLLTQPTAAGRFSIH